MQIIRSFRTIFSLIRLYRKKETITYSITKCNRKRKIYVV